MYFETKSQMPKMRIDGYPAFPATEADRLGPPHAPACPVQMPELSRPVFQNPDARPGPAQARTCSECGPLVSYPLLILLLYIKEDLPMLGM